MRPRSRSGSRQTVASTIVSARPTITADSLNAVDLFRGLPHEARSAIAARLRAVRYPAGQPVVTQSAAHNEVFFILSGTVRAAFHGAAGKDVQFRDQHAGEMFGELSAIDGRPRSAEVVALSNPPRWHVHDAHAIIERARLAHGRARTRRVRR